MSLSFHNGYHCTEAINVLEEVQYCTVIYAAMGRNARL